MTLDQLITDVNSKLTRVGSNRVDAPDILTSVLNVISFFATQISSIIPLWTDSLTFQQDGSDDGRFCRYADTNGKIRLFETKVDDNINNAPPTNPATTENAYWREVSASASAAIPEWAAGVYGPGLVIVYHNHSLYGPGLYVLLEPTRPFTSSNIESEELTQKWQRIDSKLIPITKAAHGFVANDVLTYKTAAWNKYALGDNWLAIVRHVVSASVVLVTLRGERLKGLSGLTAGSIYYAQNDGTISTTVAGDPLYMAISTTEAILF